MAAGQTRNVKVVIPFSSTSDDCTVTVNVSGGGQGIEYLPCYSYISKDSQDLARPRSQPAYGNGTSATGNVETVAGLKVQKNDEHGKPVEGVKIRITGPAQFEQENLLQM